jgi:hypothetical protein
MNKVACTRSHVSELKFVNEQYLITIPLKDFTTEEEDIVE